MKKYDFYIASGWDFGKKNGGKRGKFIDEQVARLRARGLTVFSPRELSIPCANHLKQSAWSKLVFKHDLAAINNSRCILYFDWGANGDVGAGWEVGYAVAKNIPVFCYAQGDDISLMISNSTKVITNNIYIKET